LLPQEPREEHLDRGAAADCIQKFLATLEARVHKLGQLWTLREEQLNKNRQLSAEFVQFEKDTREVSNLSNILNDAMGCLYLNVTLGHWQDP